MKTLLFAAVAAGLIAQGALAAEPAWHKIEGTVGRLACYDAAFPPMVKKPPATIATCRDPNTRTR